MGEYGTLQIETIAFQVEDCHRSLPTIRHYGERVTFGAKTGRHLSLSKFSLTKLSASCEIHQEIRGYHPRFVLPVIS